MRAGPLWRKLYRHPSRQWLNLPASARGLGDELIRVAEDDGRVYVGADAVKGAMRAIEAQPREWQWIKAALDVLLADGFCRVDGEHLVIRNFEEAQSVVTPSAERMRRHRAGTKRGPNGDQATPKQGSNDPQATPEAEPTPRNDSTAPVTVTVEESRIEESKNTPSECGAREAAPPPAPEAVAPRPKAKRKAPAPDTAPLPGTKAREVYDAIVGDPALAALVRRPGDLASRATDPRAYPGVDVVGAVLRAAAHVAGRPGQYRDGDGFLRNWLSGDARRAAAHGGAVVTRTPQRGRLDAAPREAFDDDSDFDFREPAKGEEAA